MYTFFNLDNFEMLETCFVDMGIEKKTSVESLVDTAIVLKNFVQMIGWLGSYRLLIYQYRKGLSETWYSHQMFWYLNFATQLGILIYSWKYYTSLTRFVCIMQLAINLLLIGLLINTKTRTLERPRPADIHMTSSGDLVETLDNGQTRTTSFGNFIFNQNN